MSEKKLSAAQIQKQGTVEVIKEKIQKSKSVLILEYKKLSVLEDTALRNDFRKANVEYKVLKNTLIRKAFNDLGYRDFDSALNGTTSVAFSYGEEVAAAKIVAENSKKLADKLSAKCGLVENKFIDAKGVKDLAELPSKDVLISMMLGSLNAPISGLAGVLSATLRSLVYAVKAVHDQKAEA